MTKHDKIMAGIVTFGLFGSLIVAGFIIYTPPKDTTNASAANFVSEKEKEIKTENLSYKDDSGFSFSYPSGIAVTDKTPEDGKYYSVLSLQKDTKTMTVSMEDTSFVSIGDWLIADDVDRELVGAVSLDGISARQYKSPSTLLTVAVDSGVLILIESPSDDFWDSVHDLFVTSFSLDTEETETTVVEDTVDSPTASPPTNTGNVIYEEEEVVY